MPDLSSILQRVEEGEWWGRERERKRDLFANFKKSLEILTSKLCVFYALGWRSLLSIFCKRANNVVCSKRYLASTQSQGKYWILARLWWNPSAPAQRITRPPWHERMSLLFTCNSMNCTVNINNVQLTNKLPSSKSIRKLNDRFIYLFTSVTVIWTF